MILTDQSYIIYFQVLVDDDAEGSSLMFTCLTCFSRYLRLCLLCLVDFVYCNYFSILWGSWYYSDNFFCFQSLELTLGMRLCPPMSLTMVGAIKHNVVLKISLMNAVTCLPGSYSKEWFVIEH